MNDNIENTEISGEQDSSQETSQEPTPEYLFADVTSAEASEQFGYLRDLPEQLRGLESRVTDSMSPVMEQLTAVQKQFGTQPVFDPKLEKVQAILEDYDPKLAAGLMPALLEDLKGAMTTTPISSDMLNPHISPMLQQLQQSMTDEMLPSFLDMLPFDADAVVNRDNANEPQTDLQKDFSKWWAHADAPTRSALGKLGFPYVQAMQRFGKWRADQIRKKGKAAGDASVRLSQASQQNTGGQRETLSSKLATEADGFNSVFSNGAK